MTNNILDKAMLIGIGLEKRFKDTLNELASEGKRKMRYNGRNNP